MDEKILKEIRERLDHMERQELEMLNKALDLIELRQLVPEPSPEQVQEV